MPGVVGREVQTLVSVGHLSVYCGFHTAIFLSGKPRIKEGNVVVLVIFSCDSYDDRRVDSVHVLM